MKILGINGLGVLPSASIVDNGNMVAFAEEERFTRIKGSEGLMPAQAVKYCMDAAGAGLADISYIAFSWDARLYTYYMPYFFLKQYLRSRSGVNASGGARRVMQELWKYNPVKVRKDIRDMLSQAGFRGKMPPVKFVSHHLSHAASAFFCSGLDESLILVVDGSGEYKSTSVYQGRGRDIKEIRSFDLPNSIGWFYQSITEYLGFKPNHHEGKVMALAAYGQPDSLLAAKMSLLLKSSADGLYAHNSIYSFTGTHSKGMVFSDQLEALLGPAREPGSEITQYHNNIAFVAQQILEQTCLDVLKPWIEQPGFSGNLCIAGGVGLNCKMNGVLARYPAVRQIFAPPHSSDNGAALGAALQVSVDKGITVDAVMKHAYWGPSYTEQEIEQLLEELNIPFSKEPDIVSKTAGLLVDHKVIAWFQGRMEVGSRALGNRSILANPSKVATRDFINRKIKNRELWRPFAASMLYEYKDQYLEETQESPFMTIAFKASAQFAQLAPAAIHLDGTTRPQLVRQSENPRYWNLIRSFGEQTGTYALLNTSFNLREEPIVCTPRQALNTFLNSELDCLVMESFLIQKNGPCVV